MRLTNAESVCVSLCLLQSAGGGSAFWFWKLYAPVMWTAQDRPMISPTLKAPAASCQPKRLQDHYQTSLFKWGYQRWSNMYSISRVKLVARTHLAKNWLQFLLEGKWHKRISGWIQKAKGMVTIQWKDIVHEARRFGLDHAFFICWHSSPNAKACTQSGCKLIIRTGNAYATRGLDGYADGDWVKSASSIDNRSASVIK